MAGTGLGSIIPRNSSTTIRNRWLSLLEECRAGLSVGHMELETGVHAVFAPAIPSPKGERSAFEAHWRGTLEHVPRMTRSIRLPLAKIRDHDLHLEDDFRCWMGPEGADIAAGRADAIVFVDLAYLEAALLDHVHETNVHLEFNVPITLFRQGELMDYANVIEATARMVFEGRSLKETARDLVLATLRRFGTYAEAFWQLSGLYADARWRIQNNTFVMELPARGISLALRYWELHDGEGAAIKTWQYWIESLLEGSLPSPVASQLGTFAA